MLPPPITPQGKKRPRFENSRAGKAEAAAKAAAAATEAKIAGWKLKYKACAEKEVAEKAAAKMPSPDAAKAEMPPWLRNKRRA